MVVVIGVRSTRDKKIYQVTFTEVGRPTTTEVGISLPQVVLREITEISCSTRDYRTLGTLRYLTVVVPEI